MNILETLYPINSLFFYRLIFMTELLLGELLFSFKLPKKKGVSYKMPLVVLASYVFALIYPIPTSNAFYSMVMFFAMFAFTYGMAFFVFDVNWKMILFTFICGYTVEHIAYELYFSLNNFFIAGDSKPGGIYDYNELKLFANELDLCIYFVVFVNIYWLMYVFFARKIKSEHLFSKEDNVKIIFIGSIFIVIDIIINSAVSYYTEIHYERIYVGIIALLNVLTCFFGILFIFELAFRNNLKREYAIIQEIRKEEKKQYMISKETIDMINIKCHDFRHQIRELGKQQNINEEAIANINKLINIYDQSIKTENEALNVILTEKSLKCAKHNIKFSCLVDGTILDFISEEDIYSLFGNILDNAIDALVSTTIKDKEIVLKVKKTGNMITISEKNAYEGNLNIQNGVIRSSKADLTHHGYGLKSIKMVAEKYNGTMEIDHSNNVFLVTLLFIRN